MSDEGFGPRLTRPLIVFHRIGRVKVKSLQLEDIGIGALDCAVAVGRDGRQGSKPWRRALVAFVDDKLVVAEHQIFHRRQAMASKTQPYMTAQASMNDQASK